MDNQPVDNVLARRRPGETTAAARSRLDTPARARVLSEKISSRVKGRPELDGIRLTGPA
ncbi:hypothetical protein ACWEKM_15965 [Streptomyces sp. NPDC004752]